MTPRAERIGAIAVTCLAAAIAGMAALAFWSPPPGRMEVTVLAVGAAPAALVRAPDGGLALVDAGSDPARLVDALGASLSPVTRTIDLLVLTGGERGAVAGLAGLPGHYAVRRAMVPAGALGAGARALLLTLRADGTDIVTTRAGTAWSWDGLAFRCLPASEEDPLAAGPVRPACALQVGGDGAAGALLLGDMPPPDQDEVAAQWGDRLRSDLVVAPPGGSVAITLIVATRLHHLAIPASRPPRLRGLPASVEVQSTAGGALRYAASPSGMGQP